MRSGVSLEATETRGKASSKPSASKFPSSRSARLALLDARVAHANERSICSVSSSAASSPRGVPNINDAYPREPDDDNSSGDFEPTA